MRWVMELFYLSKNSDMEKLVLANLVDKEEFFEGKRVLLDFMENFGREDCIFVGNTFKGFLPVVCENHKSENYRARTFRFNVGALHQYILISETETRYIDELVPGDKVLVRVGEDTYKQLPIARIKKEIRPFIKLKLKADEDFIDVILQSNATVSILTEKGIKLINDFVEGDSAYILRWGKASHLGNIKNEFCEES